MSDYIVSRQFIIKPEKVDEFLNLVKDSITKTLQEQGITLHPLQNKNKPNYFNFIHFCSDKSVWENHIAQDYIKNFWREHGDLLKNAFDIEEWDSLA